jgi:hypothetical protein
MTTKQAPTIGISQQQFMEQIPKDIYNRTVIFSAMYSHRLACVRLIRDTVYAMLADPAMTRSRLKRELADVCKQVEEHGC